MNRDREADIIKVAALLTAAPRWAGALLEADGVPALAAWDGAWRVAALVLSVCMAAVEGFALAYVLHNWRKQKDNGAQMLLWWAIIALTDFAIILTPYVAANVSGVPLRTILGTGALLWIWSVAVAASTGIVVASVGYAQRTSDALGKQSKAESGPEPIILPLACTECGVTESKSGKPFTTYNALAAHKRWCPGQANGKEPIEQPEEERTDQ